MTKILNIHKTSISFLLISWSFYSPALAEQNRSNQPTDARICADTLYQVSHLPKDTSRLDWPKDLKFDGLSWPQWHEIDPSEHLDVIEKAIQWPDARGNNLAQPLSDYYKRYGTDPQKQSIWEKFVQPYYLQIIRSNRLIMQSTDMMFSADSYTQNDMVNGHFIRFRTLPTVEESKDLSIGSSQPKYDEDGWYEPSWHYSVITITNFPIVNDVPISLGLLSLGGELGLVGSQLKLFETPRMPAQIYDIFLSRPSSEQNQYTVLNVFGICGRQ